MSCTTGAIAILVAFSGFAAVCRGHNESVKTIYHRPEGCNNYTKTAYTWIVGNTTWRVFFPKSTHAITARESRSTITDRWSQIELKPDGYPNITIHNGGQFIGSALDRFGIYRRAGEEYEFRGHKTAKVIMRSAKRRVGWLVVQATGILYNAHAILQLLTENHSIDISFEQCAFRNKEDDWLYYDRVLRSIQLTGSQTDSQIRKRIVVYLRNKTVDGQGYRANRKYGNIWIAEDGHATVKFGPGYESVKIAGRWNLELIGNELRTEFGIIKWTPYNEIYRIEARLYALNISTVADWLSASITMNDFTYTVNNTNQIWSLADRTVIRAVE